MINVHLFKSENTISFHFKLVLYTMETIDIVMLLEDFLNCKLAGDT